MAFSISLASYADNFISDGIEYSTISDTTVCVANGQNASGDVVIPEEVENNRIYKVTSIAQDAFSGNYDMTSISIPNSVTSIGDDAFSRCQSLLCEKRVYYILTFIIEAGFDYMNAFCERKFRSMLLSGIFTKAVMYITLLCDSIIAGYSVGEAEVSR